ncbi:hypothetical protein BVZ79_01175B, partial [Haemophilus influenzae]
FTSTNYYHFSINFWRFMGILGCILCHSFSHFSKGRNKCLTSRLNNL